MKTMIIGKINFDDNGSNSSDYMFNELTNELNRISSVKYEFKDCLKYECDVVFYSLYDDIKKLNMVKGHPLLIYWTFENKFCGANYIYDNPFTYYKNNNLSISFYDDSIDNLFFPFFALFLKYIEYVYNERIKNKNVIKNKFCTFIASNENQYDAQFRTDLVKFINKNYKTITCCGKVLNNTDNNLLPKDYYQAAVYHKDYRFNLCFENSNSSDNLTYLTEKLVFAYMYDTIPIYRGAERVNEWFNKNSFINCNGLSYRQILNKIITIDGNNELFKYMIHQQPMKEHPIDIYFYFIKKLDKFILNNI